MRILIASDLHGSLDSLDFIKAKVMETRPDLLLFLGDLVYHGPRNPLPASYDTIGILNTMPGITELPCPVQSVRGNCDGEVDVNLLPFPMPESLWLDADGLSIFASHGHHLPERPPLPGFLPGTVILRGHTHIPRGETIDGLHFWNPGSLSLPKGGSPRTYAIYDDGVFRVFDLSGKQILAHKPAK